MKNLTIAEFRPNPSITILELWHEIRAYWTHLTAEEIWGIRDKNHSLAQHLIKLYDDILTTEYEIYHDC